VRERRCGCCCDSMAAMTSRRKLPGSFGFKGDLAFIVILSAVLGGLAVECLHVARVMSGFDWFRSSVLAAMTVLFMAKRIGLLRQRLAIDGGS